ncbi:MAG: glucoamylase family protein [Candidatus Omnitrophota bacterium]|nr:glucoamylase family protein [Candidatus Omnitrophota bacterium]
MISIPFPKRGMAFLISTLLIVGVPQASATELSTVDDLSPDETVYLLNLYQDTWRFLSEYVEPQSGLPYDASSRQPPTSVTNVGLYLAATSIAYRTGLISASDAEGRVLRALSSLEKVETWRGIPRPWFVIRTLEPTFGSEFTYGPHLASLIAGFLVTQSTFPEIAFPEIGPKIHELIQRMDFKDFYDARTGWLKGGYNVTTNNFAVYQPWGHWYYKYFASETRLLSFYLVARGLVPKTHWFSLIRPVQEIEGEKFFVSGMEEGGLYVQYLSGLFIDESKSAMGESQRSYVRSQIKHAVTIGAPVWGWSSCLTPQGRYLAYGELRDDIVAPYASAMAAIYFPKEAVKNLLKMEELGARPSQDLSLGEVAYGFKDSLNWKTGDTAKHYLTPNQAMAFLSLANLLHDGIVWQSFREAPIIDRRIEILNTELELVRT